MAALNPIIVRCRHGTGYDPLDGRDARQDRDWPTRTGTDRRGPVWTLPKQPITFGHFRSHSGRITRGGRFTFPQVNRILILYVRKDSNP